MQVSPVPFNERENDFTRAPKVSSPGSTIVDG